MSEEVYGVIFNWLDFEPKLPFVFNAEFSLARANETQRTEIREFIQTYYLRGRMNRIPYEYGSAIRESNGRRYYMRIQDSKEHLYWVVNTSFTSGKADVAASLFGDEVPEVDKRTRCLQDAFNLSSTEIRMGWSNWIYTFEADAFFHNRPGFFMPDFSFLQPIISLDQLIEAQEIYQLLDNMNTEYQAVTRALQELEALEHLPLNSRLRTLGYFAIIETLITHNPTQSDRGDSISRQLKAKISLLNNRFNRPVDLVALFGNEKFEKVIGKCRTSIHRHKS